MQDTEGAQLQPRVKAELTKLAAQAVALDAMAKKASKELDAVKRKIRFLVGEHAGAIPMEERSRYWRVPNLGMQVRVTYPSQSPVMDYELLRLELGDDLFAEVTTPTAYELVPSAVNSAIGAELLTEGRLAKCIREPPARDPSVYIEKLSTPGNAEQGA